MKKKRSGKPVSRHDIANELRKVAIDLTSIGSRLAPIFDRLKGYEAQNARHSLAVTAELIFGASIRVSLGITEIGTMPDDPVPETPLLNFGEDLVEPDLNPPHWTVERIEQATLSGVPMTINPSNDDRTSGTCRRCGETSDQAKRWAEEDLCETCESTMRREEDAKAEIWDRDGWDNESNDTEDPPPQETVESLWLIYPKGNIRPTYARWARDETDAREQTASNHPAGYAFDVRLDDGTAARSKLYVTSRSRATAMVMVVPPTNPVAIETDIESNVDGETLFLVTRGHSGKAKPIYARWGRTEAEARRLTEKWHAPGFRFTLHSTTEQLADLLGLAKLRDEKWSRYAAKPDDPPEPLADVTEVAKEITVSRNPSPENFGRPVAQWKDFPIGVLGLTDQHHFTIEERGITTLGELDKVVPGRSRGLSDDDANAINDRLNDYLRDHVAEKIATGEALHEELNHALHQFAGCRSRWAERQAKRLSDDELRTAIGEEFGIEGGSGARGRAGFHALGGKNPRFWLGTDSFGFREKPDLSGLALVAAARRLLNIPMPAGELASEPKPSRSSKGQRIFDVIGQTTTGERRISTLRATDQANADAKLTAIKNPHGYTLAARPRVKQKAGGAP